MCCAVRDKYLPRKEKLLVSGANWLDGGAAHSLVMSISSSGSRKRNLRILWLTATSRITYEAIEWVWQALATGKRQKSPADGGRHFLKGERMNWTFLQIRRSRGRKEKRRPSYIDLEVRIKRELHLIAGDSLNIAAAGDDFDTFLSLSGKMSLLIDQTVVLHPGDKIRVKFELSSATAEIGIIRKED